MEVNECNAFFVMSMQEELVRSIINDIKIKLGSVRTSQHSLLFIKQWFDGYYEYLAEKFFISSSGNPVEDLKMLHDK